MVDTKTQSHPSPLPGGAVGVRGVLEVAESWPARRFAAHSRTRNKAHLKRVCKEGVLTGCCSGIEKGVAATVSDTRTAIIVCPVNRVGAGPEIASACTWPRLILLK